MITNTHHHPYFIIPKDVDYSLPTFQNRVYLCRGITSMSLPVPTNFWPLFQCLFSASPQLLGKNKHWCYCLAPYLHTTANTPGLHSDANDPAQAWDTNEFLCFLPSLSLSLSSVPHNGALMRVVLVRQNGDPWKARISVNDNGPQSVSDI